MDKRLQERWMTLLQQHIRTAPSLATGVSALADRCESFAYTQAAWRFLNNERVELGELSRPLVEAGRRGLSASEGSHGLVMHDWSRVNYNTHTRKADRLQMTHATDVGYELQSSLLVESGTGQPIAPVAQNVVTARGVHSTYRSTPRRREAHLDELTRRMTAIEARGWDKPLVHLVDREADSVRHLRAWSKAQTLWLIRAKEGSRIEHDGTAMNLKQRGTRLHYTAARDVDVRGQRATQWIAECAVTLTRPARPARTRGGQRVKAQPGIPLTVRCVASKIVAPNGKVLSRWFLLTNVAQDIPAATIALWYYFRWQIESMFKLLKSAGHHLEQWLQDDGAAIARRLLVASAACVVVWQLMRQHDPSANAVKTFLVRLSGRAMARNRPVTAPALLHGLWILLTLLDVLDHYSLDELNLFASLALSPQGIHGDV